MSTTPEDRTAIDEARNAANDKNSTITDEDAEIIAKMLSPQAARNPNLPDKARQALEARLIFALKYIRNATGEPYAVDFVMHPKIMAALTEIANSATLTTEKLETILDIFINTSSRSQLLANALIEKHNFVEWLHGLIAGEETKKVLWLLSNLAGMCPELVNERLLKIDPAYFDKFVDIFTSGKNENGVFYGQIAVSLSTIVEIRDKVVEKHLEQFLPLCGALNPNRQARVTALNLLRNLAVDTRLHPTLLAKPDYLTAVLEPIMSSEYEFTDEETEALPSSLQYFDGRPTVDDDAEQSIIDTLYKLCDSRTGRETLRNASVYAVLREFHKVQLRLKADDELGAGSSAMGIVGPNGPVMHVLDQDNPLEAVIGILLRTEDDIGLPEDVNYGDIEMGE
uniref:Protein HGH1 homolog n=1 Tax=Panagrellus redivivus TaxID=6233 RepID=A0A7E4VEH7_PANRE